MHTTPFLCGLALEEVRTWEWQWGIHLMMFIWGAGGLVMMLTMLVFLGLVIAGLVLGMRWPAGRREIGKREFETRKRDFEP